MKKLYTLLLVSGVLMQSAVTFTMNTSWNIFNSESDYDKCMRLKSSLAEIYRQSGHDYCMGNINYEACTVACSLAKGRKYVARDCDSANANCSESRRLCRDSKEFFMHEIKSEAKELDKKEEESRCNQIRKDMVIGLNAVINDKKAQTAIIQAFEIDSVKCKFSK